MPIPDLLQIATPDIRPQAVLLQAGKLNLLKLFVTTLLLTYLHLASAGDPKLNLLYPRLKWFGSKICQKKFLVSLGIKYRAEQIAKNLPFSKKADIFYRLDRLINENKMGNLFKVIFLTKIKLNILET